MQTDKTQPKNKLLIMVLYVKIALTILIWAAPLLFLPVSVFEKLGIRVITPIHYGRLLGMAYFALVAGYIGGLLRARSGKHPLDIIIMGLISNGGASIILFLYGMMGAYEDIKPTAMYFAYFSACSAGLIAILLFIAHLRRSGNSKKIE